MNCTHCNKETTNPKFCSQSCSASYNNVHVIRNRMKPEGKCKVCSEPLSKRLTYCKSCRPSSKGGCMYFPDTLISVVPGNTYQWHSRLREISRRWYKQSDKPKCCSVCGYDKYYEVCHIKPIKDFDIHTATIGEVNDLDNLIALCPNCHWEFDHGLIDLSVARHK